MAIIERRFVICDRCKREHFSKQKEIIIDTCGRFERITYEELPEGWRSYIGHGIGMLCPACNLEYKKVVAGFKKDFYIEKEDKNDC